MSVQDVFHNSFTRKNQKVDLLLSGGALENILKDTK